MSQSKYHDGGARHAARCHSAVGVGFWLFIGKKQQAACADDVCGEHFFSKPRAEFPKQVLGCCHNLRTEDSLKYLCRELRVDPLVLDVFQCDSCRRVRNIEEEEV